STRPSNRPGLSDCRLRQWSAISAAWSSAKAHTLLVSCSSHFLTRQTFVPSIRNSSTDILTLRPVLPTSTNDRRGDDRFATPIQNPCHRVNVAVDHVNHMPQLWRPVFHRHNKTIRIA